MYLKSASFEQKNLHDYHIPVIGYLLYDCDWYSWLQRFNLIINFPILGVSTNHSALSKHDKYFNLQQKRFVKDLTFDEKVKL